MNKEPLDVIQSTIEKHSPNGDVRHIFTGHYKIGPTHKWVNFYSVDIHAAEVAFGRYVRFLSGQDNNKVIPVGKVTPLALDLDKEIERLKAVPDMGKPVYPI